MFSILVLLGYFSFAQGRPTADDNVLSPREDRGLGLCEDTSTCRVSLPTLDSALETFLCIPDADSQKLTEVQKKRFLAQIISKYLHHPNQTKPNLDYPDEDIDVQEYIEEMDSFRIVGLANLVLHNLDSRIPICDPEVHNPAELCIVKRTEDEYLERLINQLADKSDLKESTYNIYNPIILTLVNCMMQQLPEMKWKFRKTSRDQRWEMGRDGKMFDWFSDFISLTDKKNKVDMDEKLSRNIQVKFFNKLNKDLGDTWEKGGQALSFDGSKITFENKNSFLPNVKTVFTAHGFLRDASYFCDEVVKNYAAAGMDVQVVCINWKNLANFLKTSGPLQMIFEFGGMYKGEAQYAILTGWWLGRLLHHLVETTGLHPDQVHLIGFSLGAHLVGMMGTTFTSLSGSRVGRVTGLDPAGPFFAQDILDLKKYSISKDSGEFVDIIHTNGGFSDDLKGLIIDAASVRVGDMRALGHADFYPNGGQKQKVKGCLLDIDISRLKSGIIEFCNHNSAVHYYTESILRGPTGFPAFPCSSPKTCSQKKVTSTAAANHMGEFATKPAGDASLSYYLDVNL